MVEQATHNRQVTGSNPVGAIFSLACLIVLLLYGQCVSAQQMPQQAPGTQATPSSSPDSQPNPGSGPIRTNQNSTNSVQQSDQGLERISPEAVRAEFGSQMVPDAPAMGGVRQMSPQVPKDTGITETTLDVPQLKGLAGSAEFSLIDVEAEPIGTKIFSDCRGSKFHCIRVKIANNSNVGLIVESMESTLVLKSPKGDVRLSAVPLAQVLKGSGCGVSLAKKMLEATVGVTSIGLANTIFQEIMEPHKDLGVPLGPDAIRWKLERVALERRLLMPKDETLGLLFFAKRDVNTAHVTQDELGQGKLLVPMQSLAPQPAQGQIQIDLGKISP